MDRSAIEYRGRRRRFINHEPPRVFCYKLEMNKTFPPRTRVRVLKEGDDTKGKEGWVHQDPGGGIEFQTVDELVQDAERGIWVGLDDDGGIPRVFMESELEAISSDA